jgi:beta-phosphoglucomutase-like phosphatase (HAD superfamily)
MDRGIYACACHMLVSYILHSLSKLKSFNLLRICFDFHLCSCVVVEDSAIGLAAAKAAGMKCIVTKSG